MTEEQEQLINALRGAIKGICCAVEEETITPVEIQCLLNMIVNNLVATLN